MRGGGFLYSRHRGWGFIGPLPTDLQKPPPQNNRAGELGPLPSQGALLTQYTVFHNILCHYALRVKVGLPTRNRQTVARVVLLDRRLQLQDGGAGVADRAA